MNWVLLPWSEWSSISSVECNGGVHHRTYTKKLECIAPKPEIYCPDEKWTCGADSAWDFLVPESNLNQNKPTFAMDKAITGTTFDYTNGVIAGTPTTPTCTVGISASG